MNTSSRLPHLILGMMLACAALILGLGIHLARVEERRLIERDLSSVSEFAGAVLDQVRDLEARYERHLQSATESGFSTARLAERAGNVEGILQARIFFNEANTSVSRVAEDPPDFPQTLDYQAANRSLLFDQQAWVDTPGPLHYYATRREAGEPITVLQLEPGPVGEAIDRSLAEWAPSVFGDIREASIPVRLIGSAGSPLIEAATENPDLAGEPSLVLPITTRFGSWQIERSDTFVTTVWYRKSVLIVAAVASLVVASLGFLGFYHQRRALRHAEQRVSFVNRVSHELRTPLTNILLNLDLASDSIAEGSPAFRRLGLIREESSRLSRLLENVLTFSTRNRTKSPALLVPCRVSDAISQALEPFEASMERLNLRAIRQSHDPSLSVLADPDGLIQILGNLFSNVEKYAGATESFEIGISESEGEVCVAISDRGDSIAKRDVARMFQPFTRLNHATSEGVSGTGLGLSIARDLAESMGGSLNYARRDQGNVFELRLERAPANILAIAS